MNWVEYVTCLEGQLVCSKSFVGVSYSHCSMPGLLTLLGSPGEARLQFLHLHFLSKVLPSCLVQRKVSVTSLWIKGRGWGRERYFFYCLPTHIAHSWTKYLQNVLGFLKTRYRAWHLGFKIFRTWRDLRYFLVLLPQGSEACRDLFKASDDTVARMTGLYPAFQLQLSSCILLQSYTAFLFILLYCAC